MRKIGVISIGKEEEDVVPYLLNRDHYIIVQVFEENQLAELDGLILNTHGDNYIREVCEWLVECQNYPNTFIWLVLSEVNLREINMFFHMGINGWLLQENKEGLLPIVIENTFKRIVCRDVEEGGDHKLALNDLNMSVVLNGNDEISLTRSEYRILQMLYRERGTTVSYESIYEALWDERSDDKKYRVANLIFHLRKKIETEDERYVKTVRTKGYQLIV